MCTGCGRKFQISDFRFEKGDLTTKALRHEGRRIVGFEALGNVLALSLGG